MWEDHLKTMPLRATSEEISFYEKNLLELDESQQIAVRFPSTATCRISTGTTTDLILTTTMMTMPIRTMALSPAVVSGIIPGFTRDLCF